ncbi:MAG: hypothetical protein OEX02_10165 [Cyclobacteriaceae bacterium]|nr:hypothetical protein [Cyclobacteriaceae bacterium]
MKSIFNKLAALMFFVTFLTGCVYETITPAVVEVPDEVSFTLDVQPIFNESCNTSGCHNSGGTPPDLSEGSAYTSLTFYGYLDKDSAELSQVYEKINTGSMKKYANDQDRAIILAWIKQGALEN